MKHPDQARLVTLLSGSASPEEAEETFAHLASCSSCEERYRALRDLREDLDGVLADRVPASRRPLVRIRGFLDAGVGALGEFLGGDGGALRPAVPVPGGIGDPEDPGEKRRSADRAWSLGRSGEARSLLGELFRLDPGVAGRREVVLEQEGREVLRIVIDAGRREVAVLLRDGMKDVHVFLVPETRSLRRAESEPVAGADYHLALFRNVEPGRFDLVLERP